MKTLFALFLLPAVLMAQTPCEDFLAIIGRHDHDESVVAFKNDCGPFVETISSDNATKTWKSNEMGVTLTFTNSSTDPAAKANFELTTVELSSTTSKGGYTGQLPFGLKKEMDAHMISDHIKTLKYMEYTNRDLGISRSYFTYFGPINDASEGKQIKIYLEQYKGAGITSMRLKLS